jgi:hypothetical protein
MQAGVRYLNVLDDAFIAEFPPCAVSCGGEGIGGNVEYCAIAGICDVERCNRDCACMVSSVGRRMRLGGHEASYIESGPAGIGRLHRRLCC